MRTLFVTIYVVCVLGAVGAVLNIFVWEPLGLLRHINNPTPDGAHVFLLAASSLVSLIFVGCVTCSVLDHDERRSGKQ